MIWVEKSSMESVKDEIELLMNRQLSYDATIDDYAVYDADFDNSKQFDPTFGSVVYAMTPLGDTFYFTVKEREHTYTFDLINDGDYK